MDYSEEDSTRKGTSVNYQKSIDAGRLKYNRNGWGKIGYWLDKIFYLPFGICFAYVAIMNFFDDGKPIIDVIICAVGVYIISGFIFMNKLVKVSGKSLLQNKEDAINTLQYFYPDLTFNQSEDNILRDFKPRGAFNGGRVVTVLFAGTDVYFSKMQLGKGDSITPLSGPFDHIKTREIAEYFQQIQSGEQSGVEVPKSS